MKMACWKTLAAVSALLATLPALAVGVGMALDVRGAATVASGGKTLPLEITDTLAAGTRLIVPEGGEVGLVFYPTREMLAVKGPATLAVGEKAVKTEQGAAPTVRKLLEEQTRLAEGYRPRVVPAALVMKGVPHDARPRLLTPADGETVLTLAPEFAWSAAMGTVGTTGKPLRFVLQAGDGEMLHAQSVTGERLNLPSGLVLTPQRRYRWSLAVEGETAPVASAEFTLATEAVTRRLAALRPAESAPLAEWTLYGVALEAAGASGAARRVWARLAQRNPEADVLRELAQ